MLEREVKINCLYKHFKGTFHKVICIAKDSETVEDMVVYTHEEDGSVWVRKKLEFLSEVDHKKYPEVLQKYRFEEIKKL